MTERIAETSFRDLRETPGLRERYGCSAYVNDQGETCSKPAYIVAGDYDGAWFGEAYCDEHDPRTAGAFKCCSGGEPDAECATCQ